MLYLQDPIIFPINVCIYTYMAISTFRSGYSFFHLMVALSRHALSGSVGLVHPSRLLSLFVSLFQMLYTIVILYQSIRQCVIINRKSTSGPHTETPICCENSNGCAICLRNFLETAIALSVDRLTVASLMFWAINFCTFVLLEALAKRCIAIIHRQRQHLEEQSIENFF